MTRRYLLKRIGLFLFTIWVASTLNFIIPRLSPGDPVAGVIGAMQTQGATVANSADIIQSFRARFGLDDPLPVQYVKYLWALAHLDLGYSIAHFPTPVTEIISSAMLYTLGLLSVTTILTFVIGIFAGALLVWRGTPSSSENADLALSDARPNSLLSAGDDSDFPAELCAPYFPNQRHHDAGPISPSRRN